MSTEKTVKGEISQKLNLESYVQWTIEDIFCDTAVDTRYFSPRFSIPGSEWYLQMYPNGETKNNSVGWIGLYFTRASEFPINVSFDLGVKNMDGKVEVIMRDNSHVFVKKDVGCGFPTFLQRSKLSLRRYELASSGALTVICTVRIKDSLDSVSRLVELSDNFKSMFFSTKGCDATFKVQNKEFPVHRSVLASRSSVFESMFEVDMKEKNTGTVDVVDCDPDAFRDFLVYLYSGQFQVSSGDASAIYKIAHKYCIEGLKSTCVLFILSNLSVDNVVDAIILGHQFNENELQSKTQNFFDQNVFAVVATDKWITLLQNNRSLANQLLTNTKKNMEAKKK